MSRGTRRAQSLLLLALTLSLLPASSGFCPRRALQCVCTTVECRRQNRGTCEAKRMCYVQNFPLAHEENSEQPVVVRGCIDEKTPLLCENRRPQKYTGAWPLLYCCRQEWCNKNAIPTVPPWFYIPEDVEEKTKKPDIEDEEELEPDEYDSEPKANANTRDHHRISRTINPLYIAVPVAGACILLAIVIFAIFILKKQSQYIEECNYHNNLRHDACVKTKLSGKSPQKHCCYPDSERSSNGSETRLLMKV